MSFVSRMNSEYCPRLHQTFDSGDSIVAPSGGAGASVYSTCHLRIPFRHEVTLFLLRHSVEELALILMRYARSNISNVSNFLCTGVS
jgi:hypothetical protein